ncbi:hypothetical protein MUK42_25712 [Musa troglodytarum]|uniref:Uncharacterized protein n=1 Tax=Musa troglodytarum TaxID=320322 RepID=A0A9E7GSP8_9LILI|nr:hypothetical protein MUK42_25712 [Musa troglodytarum]
MAPAAAVALGNEGLKKLECLSLVSKVCTELESHIGCGDKVLAEFITELGHDPRLSLSSTPNSRSKASNPPPSDPQSQFKKKASAFPALSLQDDPDRARELRSKMEKGADRKSEAGGRIHDWDRGDRDREERRRSVGERDRDRGDDRDRYRGRGRDRDKD